MIAIYLIAIVIANLSVAAFGPKAAYVNAFLFIGLDLVSRDKLHDRWRRQGLAWRMGLLIAAGGLLSYALNAAAGRIAIASCVAFSLASIADASAYHLLRHQRFMARSNASNIAGAAADSIIFPTIAFGGFSIAVTVLQFSAKALGGLFWSRILRGRQ